MPRLNDLINRISAEYGMDPKVVSAIVRMESGGDPNIQTGSYKGLMQLSKDEFGRYGTGQGNIFDPEQNLRAGVNSLANKAANFEQQNGRPPSSTELYLMHQQGPGGLASQVANPDRPAWQNMYSTAEGQQKGPGWAQKAIWGNLPPSAKQQFGNVNNVTGRDFINVWDQRLARTLGSEPVQVASLPPAQPQNVPLPPSRPQPSIWDSPQVAQNSPAQTNLGSILKGGLGATPANAAEAPTVLSFNQPPIPQPRPDMPPEINQGASIPSIAQQPPSLGSAAPQDIYNGLAATSIPLPPQSPPATFAERFGDFTTGGGATPASANIPPVSSQPASLGDLPPPANVPPNPVSFADRFSGADPFNRVMSGTIAAQPFQTSQPPSLLDAPKSLPLAPQTQIASAPPPPPAPPSPQSTPFPQPRPTQAIGQNFAQSVNSYSDPWLSQNNAQLFNMQQGAIANGSAPWAGLSNPPTVGAGLQLNPATGNPLSQNSSGIFGQQSGGNQIFDSLKSILQNGPFAALFGGPISASSNLTNSFMPTNSFSANVPDSGMTGINNQVQATSMDPTLGSSNTTQNPFASLFQQFSGGGNNIFGGDMGGGIGGGMFDTSSLMPAPDMGAFASPSSMDFGIFG